MTTIREIMEKCTEWTAIILFAGIVGMGIVIWLLARGDLP